MLPTLEANAEPLPQSHSPSISVFHKMIAQTVNKQMDTAGCVIDQPFSKHWDMTSFVVTKGAKREEFHSRTLLLHIMVLLDFSQERSELCRYFQLLEVQ